MLAWLCPASRAPHGTSLLRTWQLVSKHSMLILLQPFVMANKKITLKDNLGSRRPALPNTSTTAHPETSTTAQERNDAISPTEIARVQVGANMDRGNPPKRTATSTFWSTSVPHVAWTVPKTTRENNGVQEEIEPESHKPSCKRIELLEKKMAKMIGLVDGFAQLQERLPRMKTRSIWILVEPMY